MSFQYEAAIANTVIQKINSDGGVFITECFERYLTCFTYRRLGSRTSIQMKTLVTIGRHAVLTNSLIDLLPCKKPVEQYQRSLWIQHVY